MKAVEFCYWLQGMFELTDPVGLTPLQTTQIRQHLALVFKHEIDPSYSNSEELDAIHSPGNTSVQMTLDTDPKGPGKNYVPKEIKYRC